MLDPSDVSRFKRKVVVRENGCHEWSGLKTRDGYGLLSVKGRNVRAHRFAYTLATGESLEDPKVCVCHACDNPSCVNPAHLWLGTSADNTADRSRKGRTSRKGAPPKLTDEQVLEALAMLASGNHSCAEVARHFGVSKALVTLLRKGGRYKVTADLDLTVTDSYKKQRLDGHHNPNAKLSPADIEEVLNLRSAGLSQAAIAKKFNVTQTCISRVLLRTFSLNAEA